MSHSSPMFCAAMAVLLIGAWAPVPATAIGYFNMPGSFCQCFGYGCGAGYHAPLVLGPVAYRGCCAGNLERLPYAPCPTGCYANRGCVDFGCSIGEPSMLEPTAAPAVAPASLPAPMPAPAPAAYRVPFRY